MMHQPENSAFAWGLEPPTMSSESPTKRRRTTTHKYIEQDLQQTTMEMEIKTKGPRRNRTKTWPCDASRSSQQLSQDTPATLAEFSPATAALTMVAQHVKVPPWIGATAHYHDLRGLHLHTLGAHSEAKARP